MMKNEYLVVGLMSGTSLDGLDVALCRFKFQEKWTYDILSAETFEYSHELKASLASAHNKKAAELAQLHVDLGMLHGKMVNTFLKSAKEKPDFISSHGHTIFHQPEHSLTLQISSAPHIAAITGLSVVADFRTSDVALGGQGAPLVPIGDLLLFPEFTYCLNLGGIANISIKRNEKNSIEAFDICVCNMMLNHVALQLGFEYDDGGKLASTGEVNGALLNEMNALAFYQQSPPKSLGKEFFESQILSLIDKNELKKSDLLRTLVEHIAIQISFITNQNHTGKLLVTGGGAFNTFLLERIESLSTATIVIPDKKIVAFKEAMIFAFLGLLRYREEVNCLASVTGAKSDHCAGAVYLP